MQKHPWSQAAGFRLATRRRKARSFGYTDTPDTPIGSPESADRALITRIGDRRRGVCSHHKAPPSFAYTKDGEELILPAAAQKIG